MITFIPTHMSLTPPFTHFPPQAIICIYALTCTWALNSRYYFSRALRTLALRCPAQLPALIAQTQAQALRHQLNIAPRSVAMPDPIMDDDAVDENKQALLRQLGEWADIPAVVRAAWQRARAERSYAVGEGVGNRLRSVRSGSIWVYFSDMSFLRVS